MGVETALPPNTAQRLHGQDVRRAPVACPCCDGQSFEPQFEKFGETFVKCRNCGLILMNPQPIPEDLLKFYDPAYNNQYTVKAGSKLRRARRFVSRIRRGFVPRGRWLDVGCSAGFVVQAAQEAGYEGFGVDVEASSLEYARREFGLKNLAQGTLEGQQYPDGFFDVISLYEVFEHIPDLNGLIRELKRILAPGGIIEIRTPDIGHWRLPKPVWKWDAVLPEHLHYFDRHTIKRILAKHGLRVVAFRFCLTAGLRVYAGH